jgi:hypothetical protein
VPVLFLVLDGLSARHVGPRLTPALAGLAETGGRAVAGGVAVMPSCTYPNHATFVTGLAPGQHGVHANYVVVDGTVRPAAEVGPGGPTIFDRCPSSIAVLGDHNLVGVMGAESAGRHWPPSGRLPADVALDELGYADDVSVVPLIVDAVAEAPDLLVAHLNGPDSTAHVHGPDSEAAHDRYRSTDAHLGTILDALAPRWAEWTVIVVSDHSQETVTVPEPVDVAAAAHAAGVDVTVVPEGGACVLAGPVADWRWLDAVPGIAGHRQLAPDRRLAWTDPGRWVGAVRISGPIPVKGVHGGPGQTPQVAVVGGGHPAAAALAASVTRTRPQATGWADILAGLTYQGTTVSS